MSALGGYKAVPQPDDGIEPSRNIGHQASNVNFQADEGDYLGAYKPSSDMAKVHAMSWAIMWCISLCSTTTIPIIYMNFDSKYAHGMANGLFKPKV